MVVTQSGITIDVIFLGHLTKVLLLELKRTPCDLSFAISSAVELESSENVDVLLVLPREGMITSVHSGNALCPIFVTREGMVTLVKIMQPENALLPMVVTPDGMTIDMKLFGHLTKVLLLKLKRTPCDLSLDISAELTAPAKSTKQKNIAQILNTIFLFIIASLIFFDNFRQETDVGLM